jgi:NTP pyrophosphatase (non-canonical NTP hydrolase)
MIDRTMNERIPVTTASIEEALEKLRRRMLYVVKKHGNMSHIGGHEMLGTVIEEVQELTEAIRSNDIDSIESKLLDVCAGALWGVASIDAVLDPKEEKLPRALKLEDFEECPEDESTHYISACGTGAIRDLRLTVPAPPPSYWKFLKLKS